MPRSPTPGLQNLVPHLCHPCIHLVKRARIWRGGREEEGAREREAEGTGFRLGFKFVGFEAKRPTRTDIIHLTPVFRVEELKRLELRYLESRADYRSRVLNNVHILQIALTSPLRTVYLDGDTDVLEIRCLWRQRLCA